MNGIKMIACRGAWMAHSVKCPTLDFGSGHDLMVLEVGLRAVSLGFSLSLSLSLSLCPAGTHMPSLSQNK